MSRIDQIDTRSALRVSDGLGVRTGARAEARDIPEPDLDPAFVEPTDEPPDVARMQPADSAASVLDWKLWSREHLRLVLIAAGIAVVVFGGGIAWLRSGRYVSTDDAYIHAAKLMVSTDVSGLVSEVDVHEGDHVTAGQLLFRVDPRQFQIALDNAKANLAQTAINLEATKGDYQRMLADIAVQTSQVALDQANFDRLQTLVRNNVVTRANFDQARFQLEMDKNKVASLQQQAATQLVRIGGRADVAIEQHPLYLQAKSQVDEMQRQLDHTGVRAPFDGIVTQVAALQPGTYLVAQTAALTNTGVVGLVSTDDLWIDANIKETELTHVKPGDPVAVSVDSYPGRKFTGTVESIAPASGSEFSILPAQNASGNWVKVGQRIPVRVRLDANDSGALLRAGMTVTVEIDTRAPRKQAAAVKARL